MADVVADERAIPRIHNSNILLKVQENIANFLEACRGTYLASAYAGCFSD
jgi:hypothetical protein